MSKPNYSALTDAEVCDALANDSWSDDLWLEWQNRMFVAALRIEGDRVVPSPLSLGIDRLLGQETSANTDAVVAEMKRANDLKERELLYPTPAMIEAGREAFAGTNDFYDTPTEIVKRIFKAMIAAREK